MQATGLQGKQVLVIDDDHNLLTLMEEILGNAGAEVCTASSGAEGLGQILLNPPDLVLLDVMMPGLDGWEVCSGIRRLSDVPIIFLTALTGEKDILQGFDHGAVDYVTKPFRARELLARTAAALRQATRRRDLEEVTTYDDDYLQVDLASHVVKVGGERVRLTQTEYRLLSFLIRSPDRC